MIMDMPPSIESDVFQALQQSTEVVSVTPSTNALNPADLLVRLHNTQTSAQANSQSFHHQVSQVLSEAIALGPLSVSLPAPTPMTGGGGNNPIEKVNFALLNGEGWIPPLPLGSGGSGQPGSSNINLALLEGEAGWLPPVPMTGGGSSKPSNDVSFALLNGEEGWVPPLPMGGGGTTQPSNDVSSFVVMS
ncbi:hypothetical protein [Shewanella surugensis]|uniref:Uncharacterized protein n=1 Tax=Shewanella surugensis TaxID=212020 RepID=A0ABT0LDT5_9GAMM|nr:hypothetical protein [Shewanella surugensis]MCL1125739.1 hypothetical protein [Shewanella surugensis]